MFGRQPLPPRDFPLVLRHTWRTDLSHKIGRLRALERRNGPRTERPPRIIESAQRGRIAALNALTPADREIGIIAAE